MKRHFIYAYAQDVEHVPAQANVLDGFDNVYYVLGKDNQVINHYRQCLKISQRINDRDEEKLVIARLGNVYFNLQDYHQALDHYQKSLKIAQDIGDSSGEATALCNLGASLMELRQDLQALELLQQAREIYRVSGARPNEILAVYNLAELYQKLGNTRLAHEYCDLGLTIAQKIGIFVKEGQGLKASFGELEQASGGESND